MWILVCVLRSKGMEFDIQSGETGKNLILSGPGTVLSYAPHPLLRPIVVFSCLTMNFENSLVPFIAQIKPSSSLSVQLFIRKQKKQIINHQPTKNPPAPRPGLFVSSLKVGSASTIVRSIGSRTSLSSMTLLYSIFESDYGHVTITARSSLFPRLGYPGPASPFLKRRNEF